MNKFEQWCASSTLWGRLSRTIAQGIIGVIIANLDMILGLFEMSSTVKTLVVLLVMAVLSPIQAEIGGKALEKEND